MAPWLEWLKWPALQSELRWAGQCAACEPNRAHGLPKLGMAAAGAAVAGASHLGKVCQAADEESDHLEREGIECQVPADSVGLSSGRCKRPLALIAVCLAVTIKP